MTRRPDVAPPRRWSAVGLLALAGVVVVLVGCDRNELRVEVDDEGAGRIAWTLVVDQVDFDRLGGEPALRRLVAEIRRAQPDWEVETSGGGVRAVTLTVTDPDVADVPAALTTGIAGATPQPVALFRTFDLRPTADGWNLSATVVPLPEVLLRAGVPLTAPDGVTTIVSITLPGRVEAANADAVDGSTATWELEGDEVATTVLDARTGPVIDLDRRLVIAAGALGVVLLGVVLAVAGRNASVTRQLRRRAAVAVETPGSWDVADGPPAAPSGGATGASPGAPAGAPAGASDAPAGAPEREVAIPVGGRPWGPAPEVAVADVAAAGAPAPGPTAPDPAAAAPGPPAPAPGWYPDPDPAAPDGRRRWWDGSAWTQATDHP